MQTGNFPTDDLPALAREAFEGSGLTQAEAAERLGVSQPSIAQALSKRAGMDALRRRIIEAFTSYCVEGPEYRLVEAHTDGEAAEGA